MLVRYSILLTFRLLYPAFRLAMFALSPGLLSYFDPLFIVF